MARINFIGLSYLLVYVGAVSILFFFILMLINVRISELTTDNNNSIPSGIIVTIIFSLVLYKLLPHNYKAGIATNISPSDNYDLFVNNIEPTSLDILNNILF